MGGPGSGRRAGQSRYNAARRAGVGNVTFSWKGVKAGGRARKLGGNRAHRRALASRMINNGKPIKGMFTNY